MKRTGYYGMAFLVFVVTIMLLYGGSFILAVGAAVGGAVMGGDAGIDMIYETVGELSAGRRFRISSRREDGAFILRQTRLSARKAP